MLVAEMPQLTNFFGFLALISYIVTLIPGIVRAVFPTLRRNTIARAFLKYRRQIGILAFLLAAAHGKLLINQREFDFLDSQSYSIYFTGIASFSILTALAVTSNDLSIRIFKRNWKRLHKLTYLVMILLLLHVLTTMSGRWNFLTAISLMGLVIAILLFIRRKIIDYKQRSLSQKR